MKLLLTLAVLCFVASVRAACTPSGSLSFCSVVNWDVDQELFTEIGNKGTYVELMDKALSKAYDLGKEYVEKVAEKNGFEVCEDCLNEFKDFLCAGAFPKCGIWSCLSEKVKSYVEVVLEEYGCDGVDDISCIQKNYQAILKALKNIPAKQFQDCYGEFMPSNAMCKGVIDICSCGHVSNDVKNKVCQFFSANGNSWTQDGSCADVNGWCEEADENTRKRAEGDDGTFPINANLKLNVGQPAATTVLSVGLDEESSMNEPESDKLGFIPEEEEEASSASIVSVFALLYLFVALLF